MLWVRADDAGGEDVAALERLVSALGGTLLVRPGNDLVASARDVAKELAATYLVVGRPRHRTALHRLVHDKLALELMHAIPGTDVQIVALPDV